MISVCDRALRAKRRPLPVAGVLDEPAHAATTVLLLSALGRPLGSPFARAAVIASVAIDVDHLPQYLGKRFLTRGTARPYPHSLVTLGGVGAVALMSRGRWRQLALGVELGLAGHLFRDMTSSRRRGGVPLFWPRSRANVRLPYSLYPVVMGATLAGALSRSLPSRDVAAQEDHE